MAYNEAAATQMRKVSSPALSGEGSLHDQFGSADKRIWEMASHLTMIADRLFGPEPQLVSDQVQTTSEPNSYATTMRHLRSGLTDCERAIARIQENM